jgi:hypothetical protein
MLTLQVTSKKTVNKWGCGSVCRRCNCLVELTEAVGGIGNNKRRIYCSSEEAKEFLWLKGLIGEFGENGKLPTLFVDKASAVKLARKPVFHKQSKLIEVRYYSVRECYEEHIVEQGWNTSTDLNS